MRTGKQLISELTGSTTAINKIVRKGRNAEMIARRDTLLVHRYVYYGIYTELRSEAINSRLEEEFHLTERHFLNIIYDRAKDIRALKTQPPTIGQLRKMYPHFNWSTDQKTLN